MADDRTQLSGPAEHDTLSTDRTVALPRSGDDGEPAGAAGGVASDPLASMSAIAVGEIIGEGGMGVVRAATQRSLG